MNIFVSAPLTNKLEDGRIKPEFRQELCSLYQYLRDQGHEVVSAHEREDWGHKLMCPDQCTPLDLEGIENCNLLVAVQDEAPSGGVSIEIGYAAGKKKPIIHILKEEGDYSPVLHGLHTKTRSIYLYFRLSVSEVVDSLQDALNTLLPAEAVSR